jgi:hypothetical protein
MQNKYFLLCGLMLFLSFSCRRDFQLSNQKQETTDTVFINLDTIRMLNFGDFFSKIEIIPLWEPYDETIPYPLDSFFSSFDKHVYIHTGLSNELYRVDAEKLSLFPVMITDYGKKTITPEIMKNCVEIPDYQMLEGGHYAHTVDIFQNSKYYLIETWYLQHTFLTFYDKQSRETKTGIDQFSNGITISHFDYYTPDIQSMDDEALRLVVRDLRINSVIDTLYLTDESKKRLSKMKKTNQAVIIKYFFNVP